MNSRVSPEYDRMTGSATIFLKADSQIFPFTTEVQKVQHLDSRFSRNWTEECTQPIGNEECIQI
jgi:hypothetical protein